MEFCCSNFKKLMMQHYESSKDSWNRYSAHKAVPCFVLAAIKWLDRNSLTAALSDKDGVFVVIDNNSYNEMLSQQLSKHWYKAVYMSSIRVSELFNGAHRLISRLARFVNPQIINDCRGPLRRKRSSAFCKLSCTIKTHKAAGEVCARPIHMSNQHFLEGLSAWVDLILSSILRKKTFICASSKNVINGIRGIRVDSRSCLCKCDIKDFYMEGAHNVIVTACVNVVSEALEEGHVFPGIQVDKEFIVPDFEFCLRYILDNQYIDANISGVTHQMVVGSGMGMKHSGGVSSVTFYDLVEKNLFECGAPDGVLAYMRYHDDILLIGRDVSSARSVCERVCRFS